MYLVYHEEAKSHRITILASYPSYVEAHFNLNKHIEQYLAEIGQNKLQFIKHSSELSLKEYDLGYYLKRSNRHANRLHLFHKTARITQGYLWNGQNIIIEKLRWFGILELAGQAHGQSSSEIEKTHKSQTSRQHGEKVKLLDELKQKINRHQTNYQVDTEGNLEHLQVKKIKPSDFALELSEYVKKRATKLILNNVEDSDESESSEIILSKAYDN